MNGPQEEATMSYRIVYQGRMTVTAFIRFGDLIDIFREEVIASSTFTVEVRRDFYPTIYNVMLIQINDRTISEDHVAYIFWVLPTIVDVHKVIAYFKNTNWGAQNVVNYLGLLDWNHLGTEWRHMYTLNSTMIDFIHNEMNMLPEDLVMVFNVNLTDSIVENLICEHVHPFVYRFRNGADDYVVGYACNRNALEDEADTGKLYGATIYDETMYSRYFGFCAETYLTKNGRRIDRDPDKIDICALNFTVPIHHYLLDSHTNNDEGSVPASANT